MTRTADNRPTPIPDLADARAEFAIEDGAPALYGTVCSGCHARSFLARKACFECGAAALEATKLARAGALYSFSVVHVSSTRPTPYTIGYVDLDDGVRVLATIKAEQPAIDQRVELIALGDGWGFAPEQGPRP